MTRHGNPATLCFIIFTWSVRLVCPQRSGTDLREDIKSLIKFWQAIFQDRKSLLAILNIESKQRSVSMSSDIGIYSVSHTSSVLIWQEMQFLLKRVHFGVIYKWKLPPGLCLEEFSISLRASLPPKNAVTCISRGLYSSYDSKSGWIPFQYRHQLSIQAEIRLVQCHVTNNPTRSTHWSRICYADAVWLWRWSSVRLIFCQPGIIPQLIQILSFPERIS